MPTDQEILDHYGIKEYPGDHWMDWIRQLYYFARRMEADRMKKEVCLTHWPWLWPCREQEDCEKGYVYALDLDEVKRRMEPRDSVRHPLDMD